MSDFHAANSIWKSLLFFYTVCENLSLQIPHLNVKMQKKLECSTYFVKSAKCFLLAMAKKIQKDKQYLGSIHWYEIGIFF